MKTVLAILAFSGLILCIHATCDSGACPKVTNSSDCKEVNDYLDCLHKEADGCKATGGDIATKLKLETMIGAGNLAKKLEGCGACAVTVSATTLLLALIAAFMKM